MRIKIIIFTFILFLLLPIAVLGKTDTAPGQVKQDVNKTENNPSNSKAVVGSVENVTDKSVIFEEKRGNKKEAEIDKNTKILGKDKKEMKLGSMKLKDIIALISTDSAAATSGAKLKKISKVFIKEASESALLKRRAVMGIISEINGSTLTLVHQIQRERTALVVYNDQTVITSKSSKEGTPSASLTTLQVGQRITAVGDLVDGKILAKRIHVIPGKATGIFKKLPLATPSASLVATPSASATASALPSGLPSTLPSPSVNVSPL